MKKLNLFFILSLILFINIKSQPVSELRACWITNVDSYVLSTDKNIAAAMDYLSSIGVNLVFPVVWNAGYTLYPSNVMQQKFGILISPTYTNRDPLDKMIIEAHRNGIEVIPWFEYGFSPYYSSGISDSGHILKKYPKWALLNTSGNFATAKNEFPQFIWMSGINPEVQDFLIAMNTEVVDKYDVDGVQGDDRLPAMPIEGGYDSVTVAVYKSENSGANPPTDKYNPNWMRWRANKLNQFFSRFRDSIKARSNNLIFSSAPSAYPWGYDNYLQDSKTWVEQGIIDNFIPQLYRQDYSSYVYEVNKALSYVPLAKKDIFFSGVLGKAGSYVITPQNLINSIKYNRQVNVKGESIFFYEAYRQNSGINGDTLKNSLYKEPALLPYRNGNIWRPKAEIVNEDDPTIDTTGKWQRMNIPGFKPYILLSNDTSYLSITWNMSVPFNANFDIYTYIVPNTINATNAKYVIYSNDSIFTTIVDQKNTKNAGWYKLGTAYLTSGQKRVVKLDNEGIEKGKYLVADATMIMINRKLSPNVVITNVEDQNQAFESIPNSFILYQNYPNPFNPKTIINYQLSTNNLVTLKIYDVLGRVVETLVNKEQSVGKYSIEWDASKYSSGIYFYELVVGNGIQQFRSIKKMMLMK